MIELLADPHWAVRNGAAVGLEALADPVAIEPLRAALRKLRWHPFRWYINRFAYKNAIKALEGRVSEGQAR